MKEREREDEDCNFLNEGMQEFRNHFDMHISTNKFNDLNNKYFQPKHQGIDCRTLGSMI